MKKDYSVDHLVVDEFGINEMNCMCCGTLIAKRTYTEIDSKTEIGKKVNVLAFMKLPNFQIVEVERHNGTKSLAKFCRSCAKGDLDLKKIGEQIEKMRRLFLKHEGKSQPEIESEIGKMNFEIKRRLT